SNLEHKYKTAGTKCRTPLLPEFFQNSGTMKTRVDLMTITFAGLTFSPSPCLLVSPAPTSPSPG
ncbi:MAG: hypothetical protein ACRDEA_11510, partial [Microcystaceae cyanobacterium]